MQHTFIRLLVIALLCWLPTIASAATQSIHVEWGYTPSSESAVTGFKLYQEGAFVCQTKDPNAIAMDCDVTLTTDTTNFTLTAAFSDGSESPHSTLYAFSTTANTTLKAVISAVPLTGTAPLTVNFNATASTGSISSYSWDFGDGTTATGNTTSHVYAATGTYTAQLKITDTTGQTSLASTTVNATDSSTTPATSPTAVISSSTAMGAAPLTVNFNGSGSTTANNATIATYSWSFGDGSSATGASVAHSFVTVGTYTTTLTVTDSNGLTSSISTPVMVTSSNGDNKAPTAVISATPESGASPLTAIFDGSGSTDSDGSITSYTWNFGDGSSATGQTVTHTYTGEATFVATLQVTDNMGADDTASITVTAQPKGQGQEAAKLHSGMPWLLLLLQDK